MKRKIECVMLVDDNKDDNFFHERILKKTDAAKIIIIKESGKEALEYLQNASLSQLPDLIFLDINMPGMNGWQFLEAYSSKAHSQLQDKIIIVMLTTSDDPDEIERAGKLKIPVAFIVKPLTSEKIIEILSANF